MDDVLDSYWAAIKERVCGVCIDRLDNGTCGLAPGRVCALEMHLPRIVRAVQSVDSGYVSDYADAIRDLVCASCPNQDDGTCEYRNNFDCTLDTLTSLVVEAIESVDLAKKESAGVIGRG